MMRSFSPVALLAWALAGCADPSTSAAAPSPPPSAMPVEVSEAHLGTLTDESTFLGETRSEVQAELAAGADGEIVTLHVRLGDRVQAGDALLRIDPRLARARVAAAEASRHETHQELEQATRERRRAEKLGSSVLAESEIEQNVTRAKALEARAHQLGAAGREAKVQLQRHVLRAPFAGVISARHVDMGDWVGVGEPVLALIDESRVEVVVQVTADLVPRLSPGQTVTLRRGQERVSGTIVGIVKALDPMTRTAPVRVVPLHPSPWLLPGSAVHVSFAVERPTDATSVIIARDAVVHGAVGTRVVKAVDGRAELISVTVEACADVACLVRSPELHAGDVVVVRGNERLRPNQSITILPRPATTKTAAAPLEANHRG